MNRIRYLVRISQCSLIEWMSSTRIMVIGFLMLSVSLIYAVPFAENAKLQHESINIFETFIALMNGRFSMLIFSSMITLMFCDLPIIKAYTLNAIVKGTRYQWLLSQFFLILVASLLLTIAIVVVTIIVSVPYISLENKWSRPILLMSKGGKAIISYEQIRMAVDLKIIEMFLPLQSFMHSFMFFYLLCVFYGVTTIMIRMLWASGSYVILLFANAVAWATSMFGIYEKWYTLLSWISIHHHTSLLYHTYSLSNEALPSVDDSYLTIVCSLLAFTFISIIVAKKYDITTSEEDYL